MMNNLDIQVGDRVTHEIEGVKTMVENNVCIMRTVKEKRTALVTMDQVIIKDETQILKIERIGKNGWYTVYDKEEKKELLTEEERDFLEKFVKFSNNYINYIIRVEHTIIFHTDCHYHREEKIEVNNNFFNKLENNRKYTLSELGLEK